MKKTNEELESLKKSWMSDPCWDIEHTEGFEDHADELLIFRSENEDKWTAARKEKEEAHEDLVREQTGVADADIVSSLATWNEIENAVSSQDRYFREIDELSEQIKIELMQAQIRATLLQAAQLKRIADAIEDMAEGKRLEETVAIWGSK